MTPSRSRTTAETVIGADGSVRPMQRSAQGYWLADARPVVARPVLDERVAADVVVIGGGYLGMWTAWHARAAGADVVLLESGVCGHGPSGRNGGFLNGMWDRVGELEELFGRHAALAVAREAAASVDAIAAWCATHDVDAHLVRAPMLEVSCAPGQDRVWDDAVAAARGMGRGDEVVVVDAAAARAVCDSPLFRGGVLWRSAATVHPARLALGLRERLIDAGVRIYEHTRADGVEDGPGGVTVRTGGGCGTVVAGAGVLAVNSAAAGVGAPGRAPGGGPPPPRPPRAGAGGPGGGGGERGRGGRRRPPHAALPAHGGGRPGRLRLGRGGDGLRRGGPPRAGRRPRRPGRHRRRHVRHAAGAARRARRA